MLQYLLNMTAIWLLSLLIFDLFLRKESFHSYNRLYLIVTLLTGILLPLWSLQESDIVYITKVTEPAIENVSAVKKTIVQSTVAETTTDYGRLLFYAYATGVVVGLLLILKEVLTIVRLYRKGDKTKDGVWTIIETGKSHSPFSAFRYVFISNKQDYSNDELRMILSHEEQHGHALHFIDLTIFQLTKILCWFNPLVYIYHNRLLVVHEYQADAAVDKTPAEYGRFLIEQALLSPAPSLSHSFNRSPIKNRIMMLTRKTSALAQRKRAIAIPLLLVCVLCFTKNAFSDDKRKIDGNKVTYKGNVITMQTFPEDTTIVEDPTTGEEKIVVKRMNPRPKLLNGEKIWYDYEKDANGEHLPVADLNTIGTLSASSIIQTVVNEIKNELTQLPDDQYNLGLNNVMLNKEGEIAYYDFEGFRASHTATKIPEDLKKYIDKKIVAVMDKLAAKPATIKGKPIIYMTANGDFFRNITVEKGKIMLY
ncbi:MAG TPA: M56 family metallopeptidase [Flavipsychrobacter sp.]|nr:M56 family metallopeptidase [Flavipsychrobacter sp.]